ncbi:MAG: DNA mismatch repair endonuclease MutL [Deltaproteobacteria bacterium]|nr:MAG: DNA mismatch repair endonuclease MutL [Deltaproteobacteria bacterium]
MAPRIQRLPETLANKIAAGEVVERPSSVVKELVENALDAGASRVEVRLTGGGRDRVEVRDDGEGMGFEDARLSLERHATSKLRSAEDLFAIRTLGFRGEALPSIAGVSRMTILTRERGSEEGTRVEVHGGRILRHEAAGVPAGTTVRVEDLFYNVPARRKFLRRASTELGHATEALVRIALAHPEVAFHVWHEGRAVLDAPAGADPKERIAALLGRELYAHLHPVEGDLGEVSVRGHLASPEVTRASNRGLYVYVNGRFVSDRQVSHAIRRAYGELIDRGRSPVVVLRISLPPAAVDVNVHPQKTEVRFADGRKVYAAVVQALERTLARAPWAGISRFDAPGTDGAGADAPLTGVRAAAPTAAAHLARVGEALQAYGEGLRLRRSPSPGASPPAVPHAVDLFAPPGRGSKAAGYFSRLKAIGQLRAKFILCESEEGLVVIDQHAAHERVEFERLREAWRRRAVAVQRLLVPETVDLPVALAERLERFLEPLGALGFDLAPLGGGTLGVSGVPAELTGPSLRQTLLDVAEELAEVGDTSRFERAVDGILATVACHSVVRFGDLLSLEACQALLDRMDGIPRGANCPHGRPVAFALPERELLKRFGR